jgi:uncharacterized protein YgiM (DUF1202 family)
MTARLAAAATALLLLAGAAGAAPLAPAADGLPNDGLRVLVQAPGSTVTVARTYANLREQATTKSPKLGQVKQGQKLEVVSVSGDWVQVKAGDKTGYVFKKFVK